METDTLDIRLMNVNDISVGMNLREIAGWNQTEQDWHRFLALEPEGCFVASGPDGVIGTATTITYEKRLGWIGMVLVDPLQRGHGVGKSLLRKTMECLQAEGIETIKLDATSMGHPLYQKLGFDDEYEIERWEGIANGVSCKDLSPMTSIEFEDVCSWDRTVFGADRSRLLECLWREGPQYCAAVHTGSEISGYMLGRAGTRAHYLGPWIASEGTAEALFREMMRRLSGDRVYLDVCRRNAIGRSLVQEAGFRHQRTLTRMYIGPNRYPGIPELVCGIAGPELG